MPQTQAMRKAVRRMTGAVWTDGADLDDPEDEVDVVVGLPLVEYALTRPLVKE